MYVQVAESGTLILMVQLVSQFCKGIFVLPCIVSM